MRIADNYREIADRLRHLKTDRVQENRIEHWIRMRRLYPHDGAGATCAAGPLGSGIGSPVCCSANLADPPG